jgi:hypothetical protein
MSFVWDRWQTMEKCSYFGKSNVITTRAKIKPWGLPDIEELHNYGYVLAAFKFIMD